MSNIVHLSILQFFNDLNDPRQMSKVIYPLNEIILVALCASICGADSFVEMEAFGKSKLDFLKNFLPFKNGIPSHDTFGAVFSNLDARQFNKIFIKWIESVQNSLPKLVAIDGKTVRRSKNGKIPPIHVVSAWSSDLRLVLGQIKTKRKSNEITAIPELLSMLNIANATITIDAMGCQEKIAKKIIDKGADYILNVKKNQKNLYNDIESIFDASESSTIPIEISELKTIDKCHGRLETRIYSLCNDNTYFDSLSEWEGLKCIGKVKRICEIKGETTEEVRYFICSKNINVVEFSESVRGHWGIENSLHWVLDIVFRDDECRVREKNSAANFVTLKHITLNMLRSLPGKRSMRVRRKLAGWDNDFLHEALFASPLAKTLP